MRVAGEPLFVAPKGRSWDSFVKESRVHGWPSFRDEEVNWDYVRVLPNGEVVSVDGIGAGCNHGPCHGASMWPLNCDPRTCLCLSALP